MKSKRTRLNSINEATTFSSGNLGKSMQLPMNAFAALSGMTNDDEAN